MDDEVRIRLLMEGNWEEIVLTEVLNGNWHHERTGCPAGSGVFVEMDPNWRGHKKQRERNNTHVPSYQHFLVSKGRRKEDMTPGSLTHSCVLGGSLPPTQWRSLKTIHFSSS